jgi:geranylgeranyl pyrophosphate synthase
MPFSSHAQPFLAQTRDLIEQHLEAYLPGESDSDTLAPELVAAMRYAVLGGGKRLRPQLVCATAASLDKDWQHSGVLLQVLPAACALEFLHAYSLIHDDLPAMDDDDLRHGQPSCHKAFGEAIAILAGDALQALAFEVVADADGLTPAQRLAMLQTLSHACGWRGMVGGQALDMTASGRQLEEPELARLHAGKTGALLRAAVELGAQGADAGQQQLLALRAIGARLGLAFQMVDDLLDVTSSTARLGKTAGADAANGKNTYPALLGIDGTRQQLQAIRTELEGAFSALGLTDSPLAALAAFIIERDY